MTVDTEENEVANGGPALNVELGKTIRKPALKNWDWKKSESQRSAGLPYYPGKPIEDLPNAELMGIGNDD